MSKLNIDQQTIKELFSNKKSDFLIPDYQRPYAWEEPECQTLWDDIFVFAFPENDYTKFDSDNDEYFLGPIVTFKNDEGKLEIIDGQQRLTTLMLLLRAFYSKFGNMKDQYAVKTSEDISTCIWRKVSVQDEKFSERVLKKLFVLNYAPNGMWTYLVSVYFMQYKDDDGLLNEEKFYGFLDKITAFIFGYAFIRPGVNALRSPVYPEMINIISDLPVTFSGYKFEEDNVKNIMNGYVFTNGRPITKSILAWWAYTDQNQELISLDTNLEIEHIYSKKRQENENSLKEKSSLESLGNKALLEKNINIRASDYRFTDKIKYYHGYTSANGKLKSGTKVQELLKLSNEKSDYTEQDIVERKKSIIEGFIEYLKDNELIA